MLTISNGTAPIKVGKMVGRSSHFTITNIVKDLPMVCGAVE
jgi:hypothetical protein